MTDNILAYSPQLGAAMRERQRLQMEALRAISDIKTPEQFVDAATKGLADFGAPYYAALFSYTVELPRLLTLVPVEQIEKVAAMLLAEGNVIAFTYLLTGTSGLESLHSAVATDGNLALFVDALESHPKKCDEVLGLLSKGDRKTLTKLPVIIEAKFRTAVETCLIASIAQYGGISPQSVREKISAAGNTMKGVHDICVLVGMDGNHLAEEFALKQMPKLGNLFQQISGGGEYKKWCHDFSEALKYPLPEAVGTIMTAISELKEQFPHKLAALGGAGPSGLREKPPEGRQRADFNRPKIAQFSGPAL